MSASGLSRDSIAAIANTRRHKDFKSNIDESFRKFIDSAEKAGSPESVGDFFRGVGGMLSSEADMAKSAFKLFVLQNPSAVIGLENNPSTEELIDISRNMDDVEAELMATFLPKASK